MPPYQLYYYVPETHLEATKAAIFAAGAGTIGNYSQCAWETKGTGQFCPAAGSNPYLGATGIIEKVVEYKVETICSSDCLIAVLAALKAVHPYEQPAFGYVKLESF
jgi:structural hemagglutinin/hemolysin toxin protein RtxA